MHFGEFGHTEMKSFVTSLESGGRCCQSKKQGE